jgi:hypothetical protein
MTSQYTAQAKITRSEQRVREVADSWNAVDLAAIAQCLSALDGSAADLSDAHQILKELPATSAGSIRSDISSLRASALRLERLVDASAAFLRLVPGFAREDGALYQSGGSICCSNSTGEMRGIEG